jgi:seryl-tRNA synthetase
MLDIRIIRDNPELVKAGLAKKGDNSNIERILELDAKRREVLKKAEALKAERNKVSGEVAKKKKAGENADAEIAAMRKVGDDIAELDLRLTEIETDLHKAMTWLPNLPHESVPKGTEEDKVIVREWGKIEKPKFKIKPHWDIGAELGVLDLDAAARISGSGFYILRGIGSRLERALINFMLDLHIADGFVEVTPPYLVNSATMFGTGQLPKMGEDMYSTNDGLWLIPTAEVPVTNIYREQIVENAALPISMVAYSACFRREAGSAGKDTRGMIRVHQFDKVEMVKIVSPEESYNVLEALVNQAEKVLQKLGLPYRVCMLPAGDLSFAASKCYDLELWAGGVEKWLEISSVSNFEDFQARRMNCRFRDKEGKVRFPHTLNGSGVALARLIPAILENYQNADGTVSIPEALHPYMAGLHIIK